MLHHRPPFSIHVLGLFHLGALIAASDSFEEGVCGVDCDLSLLQQELAFAATPAPGLTSLHQKHDSRIAITSTARASQHKDASKPNTPKRPAPGQHTALGAKKLPANAKKHSSLDLQLNSETKRFTQISNRLGVTRTQSSTGKIFLLSVGAVAFLVSVALFSGIISRVLEKEASEGIQFVVSELLGTSFTMDKPSFDLRSRVIRISNVVMDSPKGFTSAHLMRIGTLEIDVDLWPYLKSHGRTVRAKAVRARDVHLQIAYQGDANSPHSTNVAFVMSHFNSHVQTQEQQKLMLSGLHACFPALLGRNPPQLEMKPPSTKRTARRMLKVEHVEFKNLALSHPSINVGSFDFKAGMDDKPPRLPEDVVQEVIHTLLACCHGRLELASWEQPASDCAAQLVPMLENEQPEESNEKLAMDDVIKNT